MNNNVRTIFTAPALRFNNGRDFSVDQIGEDDVQMIPLIKFPRTLDVLWTKYEFGIGGNKPAKLFTASERGKMKFSYSLRKPFWKLVERLIRHGYSHSRAIEKIERVYSSDRSRRVTEILREIRKDVRNGRNPALDYL